MRIAVQSSVDEAGVATPRRLCFDDRRVEVAEVCDRWDGLRYRYFRVTGDDGCSYIIRHNEAAGEWTLTLYNAEPRREAAERARRRGRLH
jgi:hypothetical protein